MKAVIFGAAALIAGSMALHPASAMTIGEFRDAYAALHALDPIPQKDRDAYVKAHKADLEVARVRLEDSVMVRDTLLRMNGLLVEKGIHPFLCNYDLEEIDDQVDLYGWVDEFRGEAMEKFKLVAGPKTDKLLDTVDFDDVIEHKMLEKFPCPASLASQPLKNTVSLPGAQSTTPHQH